MWVVAGCCGLLHGIALVALVAIVAPQLAITLKNRAQIWLFLHHFSPTLGVPMNDGTLESTHEGG